MVDKIDLLHNMINIADDIIIGGGMSNPFLKHLSGYKLGCTQVDSSDKESLERIMEAARRKGVRIHLPVDGVCGQSYSGEVETRVYDNGEVPDGWEIFDKGPKSVEEFKRVVAGAKSIFWNGPIGVFEFKNFRKGSEELLKGVVESTKRGAVSIIGGGDTAALVGMMGMEKEVSFVSTGGGATVEFMQGIMLPGVKALS